jgi:hypothetical protein
MLLVDERIQARRRSDTAVGSTRRGLRGPSRTIGLLLVFLGSLLIVLGAGCGDDAFMLATATAGVEPAR